MSGLTQEELLKKTPALANGESRNGDQNSESATITPVEAQKGIYCSC
jgi:hypothetical protein